MENQETEGRATGRAISVGVDPGLVNGGAVALAMSQGAPHEVLGAWAWCRRERVAGTVWEVTTHAGSVSEVSGLHDVGVMVSAALQGPYTLTLEGLYLDSMKKASRIITLAESAGEVVGPLLAGSVGEVRRPLASVWRGKVLRLGRASAAKAAARAIECAPLLATGLGELAGNEHACEALCIAYYGGVLAGRKNP